MELPTYTSIWRIEKRLYKLYDFRLPMPLPVGQIAVFTAVTVPYIVLLTLFGLPFNHTLFWLYVLPPGVLTWLATRPVLESKRLPELLMSQMRYLGEPSTWCRMAPLSEKDQVVMVGRVWRRASIPAAAEQEQAAGELPVPERSALPVATPVPRPVTAQSTVAESRPGAAGPRAAGAGPAGPATAGPWGTGTGAGARRAAAGGAGPAGCRATGKPVGPRGRLAAPAARAWTGQGIRAHQAGPWHTGRRCRLGRGRGDQAGARTGGTGWPGTSCGTGRATRASRLRRGGWCAARDAGYRRSACGRRGYARPGHGRPGHGPCGYGRGCGHRLAVGRLWHGRERPAG